MQRRRTVVLLALAAIWLNQAPLGPSKPYDPAAPPYDPDEDETKKP